MFYLNLFQNRSKRLEKVHVVIGHKSCDLDSLISAFTYAYFLDKVSGKKVMNLLRNYHLFFIFSFAGLPLVAESRGYSSCGAWASYCGGFSCGAQALGHLGFRSCTHRLSSCSSWTLENRLTGCGTRA